MNCFLSTSWILKALQFSQGVQVPRGNRTEKLVLDNLERMHHAFELYKSQIPAGHLVTVKYEQLVADPVGTIRKIYKELGLGSLHSVIPTIESSTSPEVIYQTNIHELTSEQRLTVTDRCQFYFRSFGYSTN